MHVLEGAHLALRLRDDPLARIAVRHGVLLAEGVEELLAADAQLRLEGARAVVDARVDNLAVARGGLGAGEGVALQKEG